MRKFIVWLIPIVTCLIAIPILLYFEQVTFAKLLGGGVIIATTIALRVWLVQASRLKQKSDSILFSINERFFLNEYFPVYKQANSRLKKEIEMRAGSILSECSFDNFNQSPVQKEDCLAFAGVLAAAVLHLDHVNGTGKIVVFEENETPRLGEQLGKPILFINSSYLKEVLYSFQSVEQFQTEIPAILPDLMRFYTLN